MDMLSKSPASKIVQATIIHWDAQEGEARGKDAEIENATYVWP